MSRTTTFEAWALQLFTGDLRAPRGKVMLYTSTEAEANAKMDADALRSKAVRVRVTVETIEEG